MDEDTDSLLPCSEKLAFDSREQAQAAATTAVWQRGAKVRPYQCRHCGLWHLSSDYRD